MKKYILIGAAALLFFCSCEDGSEGEVKDITPTAHSIDSASLEEQFNTHSENLRILFRNNDNMFRGCDFGSSIDDILKNESSDSLHAILAKKEATKLSYDVKFSVLEEADVLYIFDAKGKLIKIESDIYPKDQQAQLSLYNEIQFYLKKKWGEPTEKNENQVIWKLNNPGLEIQLKKAGNDKIFDLELDFISGTNSVIN